VYERTRTEAFARVRTERLYSPESVVGEDNSKELTWSIARRDRGSVAGEQLYRAMPLRVRTGATGLVRPKRLLSSFVAVGQAGTGSGLNMYSSAFASFAAMGVALALILSVPSSDPRQDGENGTEAGTEISSPAEQPHGEARTFDLTSPASDPLLLDDGTQKDGGPFNPD
jgi:hypothetical protein